MHLQLQYYKIMQRYKIVYQLNILGKIIHILVKILILQGWNIFRSLPLQEIEILKKKSSFLS